MNENNKKIIDIPEAYRPEIEELPGDLSRIAARIEEHFPGQGVLWGLRLAQMFPGQPIYMRNIQFLIRQMRDDAIRCEYDRGGITMVLLADKWGLCHRRIKQILAQPGSREELEGRQLRMF